MCDSPGNGLGGYIGGPVLGSAAIFNLMGALNLVIVVAALLFGWMNQTERESADLARPA